LDILPGWKTYLAALGLLCGAIYFALVEHDYPRAYEMFFAALAAMGLRNAVDRGPSVKSLLLPLLAFLCFAGFTSAQEIKPGLFIVHRNRFVPPQEERKIPAVLPAQVRVQPRSMIVPSNRRVVVSSNQC
jgi:hypothetical protein